MRKKEGKRKKEENRERERRERWGLLCLHCCDRPTKGRKCGEKKKTRKREKKILRKMLTFNG